MNSQMPGPSRLRPIHGRGRPTAMLLAVLVGCIGLQGCALLDPEVTVRVMAIPQPAELAGAGTPHLPPVADTPTKPVEILPSPPPDEALVKHSAALKPPDVALERVSFSLLRLPPAAYQIGAGDVLGVWIEGVLGERGQSPPTRPAGAGDGQAACGFPIPVRADGTVSLPLIDPLRVEGMTPEQAEQAVRKAYTVTREILRPGRESLLVTLLRPREIRVLVVREDLAGAGRPAGIIALSLPVYQNDVLHALAGSGGMPNPDTACEVAIERAPPGGPDLIDRLTQAVKVSPEGSDPFAVLGATGRTRIPLIHPKGEPVHISPADVTLHSGDVVVIRSH